MAVSRFGHGVVCAELTSCDNRRPTTPPPIHLYIFFSISHFSESHLLRNPAAYLFFGQSSTSTAFECLFTLRIPLRTLGTHIYLYGSNFGDSSRSVYSLVASVYSGLDTSLSHRPTCSSKSVRMQRSRVTRDLGNTRATTPQNVQIPTAQCRHAQGNDTSISPHENVIISNHHISSPHRN